MVTVGLPVLGAVCAVQSAEQGALWLCNLVPGPLGAALGLPSMRQALS